MAKKDNTIWYVLFGGIALILAFNFGIFGTGSVVTADFDQHKLCSENWPIFNDSQVGELNLDMVNWYGNETNYTITPLTWSWGVKETLNISGVDTNVSNILLVMPTPCNDSDFNATFYAENVKILQINKDNSHPDYQTYGNTLYEFCGWNDNGVMKWVATNNEDAVSKYVSKYVNCEVICLDNETQNNTCSNGTVYLAKNCINNTWYDVNYVRDPCQPINTSITDANLTTTITPTTPTIVQFLKDNWVIVSITTLGVVIGLMLLFKKKR